MTSKGLLVRGEWKIPAPGQTTNDFQKAQNAEPKTLSVEKLDPTHKYHLYVAMGCPFANSARIALQLKNLEDKVDISFVATNSSKQVKGWVFDDAHPDKVLGKKALWEVYVVDHNTFTGRVVVPFLLDVTDGKYKPVSNESTNLMKLFDDLGGDSGVKLFPNLPGFQEMFDRIVKEINLGVYSSVFSTSQQDYDAAVNTFFKALDYFEDRLSKSRYLWSNTDLTACDVRLFVTLLRWEFVYHHLFDLNKKTLTQYPNLFNFTKELYQHPKIRSTIHIPTVRQHYYLDFILKNPKEIIPIGPDTNLEESHDRDRFKGVPYSH